MLTGPRPGSGARPPATQFTMAGLHFRRKIDRPAWAARNAGVPPDFDGLETWLT